MYTLLTAYFFIIGLCFGSFALATAWRIKKGKDFVKGRSQCEHCHHQLAAKDLVPLFSWLSLRGKCRYCHKKLPAIMPLAELTGGLFFALSYYSWPYQVNSALALGMAALWGMALVLLLILFFYDLQWFILPNKVMYPLWAVSGAYALLRFAQDPSWLNLVYLFSAVVIAAGLFYLFFIVSKGKWIGFGDVRLGVAIGLLVSTPIMAGLVLFIASLLGILVALPSLLSGSKKLTSKVPFGPLLIVGLVITVLYGQLFADWYMRSILLI